MTATTVPTFVHLKPRHLVGLMLAVALLAAALTAAIASIVIDHSTGTRAVPAARPVTAEYAESFIRVEDRPLTVADAYHGTGLMFCLGERKPVTVADAYHGVGLALCA
jgi:hypothetical protein